MVSDGFGDALSCSRFVIDFVRDSTMLGLAEYNSDSSNHSEQDGNLFATNLTDKGGWSRRDIPSCSEWLLR